MKYQRIIFILCLIIFLVSITSVTASDVNETIITNDEDNQILQQENDDIIGSANTTNNVGTFDELQDQIYNADEGATINLDKDYKYNDGFSNKGIVIYKNLTINGNGHTINGLSKSRIFLITYGLIDNTHVVLKNIKMINGHTDLYGGAIFNYANLTVDNCQFTNNYAKYCGGAINSVGFLKCKNSKFIYNVAGGNGGALFTLSFEKSHDFFKKLYQNTTPTGEMSFISSLISNLDLKFTKDLVYGCSFTENVAQGTGGGAIYAYSHISINLCNFKSNTGSKKGGAVFGNKDLYIKNSKFTGNSVKKYGGAVYFKCHEASGYYKNKKWISTVKYYDNYIKDSTFTKNSAAKGGAIYGFTTSSSDKTHCAKAIRCTFTNNNATSGKNIYGCTASKCVVNDVKLTLNSITIKKSAAKLVLTAKLTKGKTLLSGKKITFKFNGKVYTANTNTKGIAKITISKSVLNKLTVGETVKYQARYGSLLVIKSAKVIK